MNKLVVTLGILTFSTGAVFAAATGSLSTSPQQPKVANAQIHQVAEKAKTGMPAMEVKGKEGNILATHEGKTLYSFDKDTSGVSNCDAKCLKNWPAFKASAKDVASGDWSKVKSSSGGEMWAYKGMPLYTYAKDKKAGDEVGNGMGGVWHVVKN